MDISNFLIAGIFFRFVSSSSSSAHFILVIISVISVNC